MCKILNYYLNMAERHKHFTPLSNALRSIELSCIIFLLLRERTVLFPSVRKWDFHSDHQDMLIKSEVVKLGVLEGLVTTSLCFKNKWKWWYCKYLNYPASRLPRASLQISGACNQKQPEPPDWCLWWGLQHDGFWLEGLIGDGCFCEVVNRWRRALWTSVRG